MTEPRFNENVIAFERVRYEFPARGVTDTVQEVDYDREFYVISGAPCNGFGVGILPQNVEELNTVDLGVTKMACPIPGYAVEDATNYERSVGAAFGSATGLYLDGADTAYVAGPKGALKLTRAQ